MKLLRITFSPLLLLALLAVASPQSSNAQVQVTVQGTFVSDYSVGITPYSNVPVGDHIEVNFVLDRLPDDRIDAESGTFLVPFTFSFDGHSFTYSPDSALEYDSIFGPPGLVALGAALDSEGNLTEGFVGLHSNNPDPVLTGLKLPAVVDGAMFDYINTGVFYFSDTNDNYSVNSFQVDRVVLTPVPEPSAYGAAAGAILLGVVLFRRRTGQTV